MVRRQIGWLPALKLAGPAFLIMIGIFGSAGLLDHPPEGSGWDDDLDPHYDELDYYYDQGKTHDDL